MKHMPAHQAFPKHFHWLTPKKIKGWQDVHLVSAPVKGQRISGTFDGTDVQKAFKLQLQVTEKLLSVCLQVFNAVQTIDEDDKVNVSQVPNCCAFAQWATLWLK